MQNGQDYSDFAEVNNNQHGSNETHSTESHGAAEHAAPNDAHQAQAAQHGGGAHDAHGAVDSGPSGVFPEIFKALGDHHSLSLFNKEICELPVIVYDSKEGFHAYKSMESMKEAGVFTLNASHKIARASNPEETVSLDLSITNLVVFQWVAIIVTLILFRFAAKKYKEIKKAPTGIQNIIESIVMFVRNDVVVPNVGGEKIGDRLLPYFLALFFFILLQNLIGLLPGGHTATGAIGCTAALAVTALIVINATAIKEIGIGNWFKHLLGGAPVGLAPIMIPIEIISMFTKPFALTIRLFANMTAGHVVLFSLVGLIFYFFRMGLPTGAVVGGVAPVSVAFSIFMYFLELLVAFLQAYIFTILTAVFTGLAIGDHKHDESAHHAH